jgi:hypothetical protein
MNRKRIYYTDAERKKLVNEKQKVMEKYQNKIAELQNKNSQFLDNAPRNPKFGFKLDLNILKKVKGFFKLERSRDLIIRSEDGLQYMDMWFKRDKENFRRILKTLDEDHKSLLKNIDRAIRDTDKDLEQLSSDIRQIDRKLMNDPSNPVLLKQANEKKLRKYKSGQK